MTKKHNRWDGIQYSSLATKKGSRPKDWGVDMFWLYRKKSSFLAAPNLTFFIFPKEAVQQVKAKKCISR